MKTRRARGAAAAVVGLLALAWGLATGLASVDERRGEPPGADAPAYVRIARTLLATGSIVLPGPGAIDVDGQQRQGTVFGSPWSLATDGRLLPKHSWLFGALLVPGMAVAGAKGALAEAVLLGAALAAFLTWRASRDAGAVAAAAAALLVLLAQPGGRWVLGAINVDVAIAAVFLLGVALAADGHPLAAGLVAGLLPLLRPTALLFLVAVALVVAARGARAGLARLAAGLAPGFVAFGLANTLAFGAPWVTAYQRTAVWDGAAFHVASHASAFGTRLLPGLRALLFDPGGGLLATAPAALLAVLAFAIPEVRTLPRAAAWGTALAAWLSLAGYSFVTELAITSYRFAFPLVAASVEPVAGLLALFGAAVAARAGALPRWRTLTEVRFLRFLAVGVLNTLFGYGVFAGLFLLGVHYAVAAAASTVLGVLFNFFSTGRLVFGSRDHRLLPRFLLVYGINYVVGVALLRGAELLRIPILLASAVLLLPMAALAYVLQRRIVFGGGPRNDRISVDEGS